MMHYIKVTFRNLPESKREILAGLLAATEMTGMEEEAGTLSVYYEAPGFPQTEIKQLARRLELGFEQETLQPENWNKEWEQHFPPILIGGFCSIRAYFHPKPEAVAHDIVITPKMAFGTGHHATTEMMILFMREMDFSGKRVFDFGTGTGILAVLAEQLGAREILAADHDDWSVENALEHVSVNHCRRIQVIKGSLGSGDKEPYDIILANVNRQVLLEHMKDFPEYLKAGGLLLVSGILNDDDVLLVREAAEQYGLAFSGRKEKQQWAALLFQLQDSKANG